MVQLRHPFLFHKEKKREGDGERESGKGMGERK